MIIDVCLRIFIDHGSRHESSDIYQQLKKLKSRYMYFLKVVYTISTSWIKFKMSLGINHLRSYEGGRGEIMYDFQRQISK